MNAGAGFTGKKLCLYILTGLFVLTVSGCGALTEDESETAVLTDDFSSYSSFPASPWNVVSGDSSSWSMTSSSSVYAARFNTSSSVNSLLLNSNFYSSGKTSVIAKIKIVSVASSGGEYGLYLRALSDLTSCYQLIFDSTNSKIYICRAVSGLTSVLNSASLSVSSYMTSYHTYKFKLYENDDGTVTLGAYIDGSLVMNATDSSPLTAGYYTGFFFSDVTDGYIMKYQITQP